jgi:hypothetical protein
MRYNELMNASGAKLTAKKVMDDLTGRSGFDNVWDDCDKATRREILATIAKIIEDA